MHSNVQRISYPNVYLSLSAIFALNPDGSLKYPGGFELVKKMKIEGVAHKVFWASDQSFIKESIKSALIVAIKAMIEGGFTQEERTWSLNGYTREVFRFQYGRSTAWIRASLAAQSTFSLQFRGSSHRGNRK